MKSIKVVTGQTATGKTAYGLSLASRIQGDLINCDSRQIYKYTNIVTGKDLPIGSTFTLVFTEGAYQIGYYTITDPSTGSPVKLWLYDIIDPSEQFSAFSYAQCARKVIHHIIKEGRTPIIIGGTYFYLHQLLYGKEAVSKDVPVDQEFRTYLESLSVEELQKILEQSNKKLFSSLNASDKVNPHRLIRKIELTRLYGKEYEETTIHEHNITLLSQLNIDTDISIEIKGMRYDNRDMLRQAIRKRVEHRINNGAVEETSTLLAKGFTFESPGLHALGYKEIGQFLSGELTKEQLIDLWTIHESQYAKRQYTFMKRNPSILWNTLS